MARQSEDMQKNGHRDVILSVRGVDVAFGDKQILQHLDLDVYRGEILGFVGASGAGKSVLMRAILGLNKMNAGEIRLFGKDYRKLSEEERFVLDQRIGVMFQHGALFPWATVLENMIRGPIVQNKMSKAQAVQRARDLLARVGLSKVESRYPAGMSSGRVARSMRVIPSHLSFVAA